MASSSRTPASRPSRTPKPATTRTRGSRRHTVGWWGRRLAFVVGLLLIAGASGLVYAVWQVPLPPDEPELTQTTFMCAADVANGCDLENSIAQLSGGEDRVAISYDEVSPVFILALLAIEDREFFRHAGVNPVAVGRALWTDLRNEGITQGGSTITQQYVKNAYLTPERTWERKVREAVIAVKLERELSKQAILERYLNIIYFGRGAYGIQAASRSYFGKDASELDLAESAYLAGIISSPEAADAQRQPEDPDFESGRRRGDVRRRAVLNAMVEEDYITAEQRDAVDAMGWDFVRVRTQATNYGTIARPELGTEYFVDYVRRWLVSSELFTDAQVYGGGLRVYTSLDFEDQDAAVRAISSTFGREDDPQAALVAIDDRGLIRAMVGGTDFSTSQVNLATGRDGGGSGRQPGSSFKPVVLAEALTQGIPLETTYQSPGRITLEGADGGSDWRVANYADSSQGTLNLVDATRVSSNTAYAQLILEVGPDRVADLARRMGVDSPVPSYPSIVLGTPEVSVLEMATVFSVFANDGELVGPWPVTKVTDSRGTILWEAPTTRERVLREEVAGAVNFALHQVVERGTGTNAQFGQPAAGKTGTTENYRDAWFVGYTCRLTAAVWVGYADGETRYMTNVRGLRVAGGTFPTQIWQRFMSEATVGLDSCPFERPESVSAALEGPRSTTTSPAATGTAPATSSAIEDEPEVTTTVEVEPETTTTTEAPVETTTTTTPPPPPTTVAPPPSPPPTEVVAPAG